EDGSPTDPAPRPPLPSGKMISERVPGPSRDQQQRGASRNAQNCATHAPYSTRGRSEKWSGCAVRASPHIDPLKCVGGYPRFGDVTVGGIPKVLISCTPSNRDPQSPSRHTACS